MVQCQERRGKMLESTRLSVSNLLRNNRCAGADAVPICCSRSAHGPRSCYPGSPAGPVRRSTWMISNARSISCAVIPACVTARIHPCPSSARFRPRYRASLYKERERKSLVRDAKKNDIRFYCGWIALNAFNGCQSLGQA